VLVKKAGDRIGIDAVWCRPVGKPH
jgi:hypothetical protein